MDLSARLSAALSGRYEIQREIGRGGMSVVFLAKDLKHNRDVAIKALRPELTESVGADRFQREVEIVSHLEHIHILPLFDSGTANGVLYYVMPHVDGGSLRDRPLANRHACHGPRGRARSQREPGGETAAGAAGASEWLDLAVTGVVLGLEPSPCTI